jgi:NDP-sugar pyrophosphorylase family protein
MKAMVLAAGVGSRLDPVTGKVPKPLVPVANRPVMEHIINLLKQHGITEIAANLHYLPDMIREYFKDGTEFGVNLYFKEEKQLTGDAGGVRACRDFLDGDTCIILMGDLLTDADLTHIICEHERKGALATIGTKEVDDVSQFGVVVTDKDGFIKGFQEKPAAHEALSKHASTGIYILEPQVFDHIPKEGTYGFGLQLFPTLVDAGYPVLAVDIPTYWSDVGTLKQYRFSNFDAVHGRVKLSVPGQQTPFGRQGQNTAIEENASIQGKAIIGSNCRIERGVVLGGTVVLGDNCLVKAGAQIKDSVVWSDCTVGAKSQVTDSIVCCDVAADKQHQSDICVQPPVIARY